MRKWKILTAGGIGLVCAAISTAEAAEISYEIFLVAATINGALAGVVLFFCYRLWNQK